MDTKKALRNTLAFVAASAVALAGPLLYLFLVKRGVGDALMYSAGSIAWVVIISVLGGVAVQLMLKRPLAAPEPLEEEPEEEQTEPETVEAASEVPEDAKELYPELFRRGEERKEENDAPPAYYEALTNALNAQKAQYVPEETGETEAPSDDILRMPEAEEEKVPDIYDDLPDTLPEGYTLWEEEPEEEEAEKEEDAIPEKKRPVFGGILSRVVTVILVTVLSVTFGAVSASGYTVYSDDGLTVHTSFGEKSYSWEDCREYEIAPSFFGDRLSVTLHMQDGATVELLPSDLIFSDGFLERYGTVYAYALSVSEKMTAAGAEKTVRERNTIESEFFGREEIGEYVEKLID